MRFKILISFKTKMWKNILKIKIISLSLIFLLAISSLTIAGADSIMFDSDHAKQNVVEKAKDDQVSASSVAPQGSKEFQVSISEHLSMKVNDDNQEEKQNPTTEAAYAVHNKVSRSEERRVGKECRL